MFFNNKRSYKKPADDEVSNKKEKGQKFIPVSPDYNNTDPDYVKIDVEVEGKTSYFLVPASVMRFVVNKGEGSPDDALDELMDLYKDVSDFESELANTSGTSSEEACFAGRVIESYKTYLINKLTKDGKNIDKKTADDLCLNDQKVDACLRTIAAIKSDKTSISELKESKLEEVLSHVTMNTWRKLSNKEAKEILCYAGSHYELKRQYINNDNYFYDKNDKNNVWKKEETMNESFNTSINECLKKINEIRQKKGRKLTPHDENLLRMYINLKYLINDKKQMHIDPAGD